jgi:hypothetical protein
VGHKLKGEKRKMSKNKTATLIALLLMFAMTISLVALPSATAQGTMKTYAVISATPNPVGVGQETLLALGITVVIRIGWLGGHNHIGQTA